MSQAVLVGQVIARFQVRRGMTQEVLSGLPDIGWTHLSAMVREMEEAIHVRESG